MADELRDLTLRDLGERRIVQELIAPRFPPLAEHIVGIGDDCAVLPSPPSGHALVVTTDPCPEPVVCLLEGTDFYHWGRMTVLINLSDLAAMGARPLGLLVSTVMPEVMPVAHYVRFLDGLAEACREWSCPVVGGNIKDGPAFTATGSALGTVQEEKLLRRTGAAPGDRVLVIGEMGLFWSAVLTRLLPETRLDATDQQLIDRALYRPIARIQEGIALAHEGGATACMDSSDGVAGCLQELALVNGADIVVDVQRLYPNPAVSRVAEKAGVDPRKLLLSWGDWQLVATVPPMAVRQVTNRMASFGTLVADIGEVVTGTGKVWLTEKGRLGVLPNLASERFCKTSMFTHGLGAYLDLLRSGPLILSEEAAR